MTVKEMGPPGVRSAAFSWVRQAWRVAPRPGCPAALWWRAGDLEVKVLCGPDTIGNSWTL
jgi:hypothetical protein